MSDIFISYASEDRPRARVIASALEEQGWTVWWDRNIPPGRVFDEVISEALDSARCVIVLWSRFSVASDWVKEEATEGARRKILVPALIDEVAIPLGFRRIQAAHLIAWQTDRGAPEFLPLMQSVSQILGPTAERKPIIEARPISPSTPKQPKKHAAWLRWIASIVTFVIVLIPSWIMVFLFGNRIYSVPPDVRGIFKLIIIVLFLLVAPGISLLLAIVVSGRLRKI